MLSPIALQFVEPFSLVVFDRLYRKDYLEKIQNTQTKFTLQDIKEFSLCIFSDDAKITIRFKSVKH